MQIRDNTIKLISPAKVNLFLAVGEKQGNYHPVINIMHTILLHDVLYFNYEKSDMFQFNIEFLQNEDSNGDVPDIKLEDNLIFKAVSTLAKKLNKTKYKIDVYVEKNIPLKAGLAGGSSNAAAALVAASKIFGIDVEDETVTQTAKEIGSDVPFFLKGGCAMYTGRGEILDHTIQPINRDIILLKPINDDGLSTKDVYAQFDKMDVASDFYSNYNVENTGDHCHDEHCNHDHSMNLIDACKQLTCADRVPLFNNLSMASEALNSSLLEIKSFLIENCGPDDVLLCGSGSATFAIPPEEADIEEILEHASHHGYWTKYSQLANVRARIVPNVTRY